MQQDASVKYCLDIQILELLGSLLEPVFFSS
jgi:hypothetical protein